jgi:hypothetical protein
VGEGVRVDIGPALILRGQFSTGYIYDEMRSAETAIDITATDVRPLGPDGIFNRP